MFKVQRVSDRGGPVTDLPGHPASCPAALFTRAGTLMALPFNMKRLEPAGEPFVVAPAVAATDAGWLVATSNQGVLAYVPGQERADLNWQNGEWHYRISGSRFRKTELFSGARIDVIPVQPVGP